MKSNIRCTQGRIQVNDAQTFIRIASLLSQTLWEAPTSEIIGFTLQPGGYGLTYQVTLHSLRNGMYRAEMVSEKNFKKLHALCPLIPVRESDREWFGDPTLTSHIESYESLRDMQWETAEARKYGWKFEVNSSLAGHINVGRTMTKFIMTGGIGLMTGASRTKGQTLVTYTR